MNRRITNKVLRQWNHSPKRAYTRYGIGRCLEALKDSALELIYPGNGYVYYLYPNGRIIKQEEL